MNLPPAIRRYAAYALACALLLPAPAVLSQDAGDARQYPFTVDEDALAGAPDRSALNQPLTPADRVVVRDAHFYRVGPDGKPGTADDSRVRLFGVNLSFGTNFPTAEQAEKLARRLAKAGFNAVRLHHMDFAPGREDNPRSLLTDGPYPALNPEAVARLGHFIGVLARHGIYTNLNLYVSYRFRPEIDGLPDFGTPSNRMPIGSSLHVYYPRMIALQEQNARQTIRALGLKDNPALAMVEINNESSLLASWTRQRWNEQAIAPAYAPTLQGLWNDWLLRRYGSLGGACDAWGLCAGSQKEPLPLLARAADKPGGGGRVDRALTRLQAGWQTLMPGSGEPSGETLQRQDFLSFLADTDRAYLDRLRRVVHEETDDRVPVTGTQMSYGGVLNFDSHAAMDYIDEHQYIDHPFFPNGSSEQRDWSFRNLSLTGSEMNTLLGLSFRRDSRKPFVLSEFNLPFPNPRGAEILPIVAAFAAMQDWDGLFFFDYLSASWSRAPANFTLSGDWGKYALAGQSAQIFRQQWIQPLAGRIDVPLPRAARLDAADSGRPDNLERAVAQAGVTPPDALASRIASDIAAQAMAAAARPAPASAPPEVAYTAAQQLLTMDAPRVRGYFGALDTAWRGAPALQARSLSSSVSAADILLTPLDDTPLAQSTRLLLTLGSGTVGTQPGSVPARPKQIQRYKMTLDRWTLEPDPDHPDAPSGARHALAPAWLSRPALCVRWPSRPAAATVYPLDARGMRLAPLPATRLQQNHSGIALDLSPAAAPSDKTALSPWYEIVLDAGAPVPASGSNPECQPG